MWSAKSILSSLFIDDKSSSTPFSVALTGFNFKLLFLIYAIKSLRFTDTLDGPVFNGGGVKPIIWGGSGKFVLFLNYSQCN
jgi:hypothetical protein